MDEDTKAKIIELEQALVVSRETADHWYLEYVKAKATLDAYGRAFELVRDLAKLIR